MAVYFPDILENNNPQYPLMDGKFLKGTAYPINQLSDTGSAAMLNRKQLGMVVFVTSSQQYYGYYGQTTSSTDWDTPSNWRAFSTGSGGGGAGNPGGTLDGQIQYKDGTTFGGAAHFLYDDTVHSLQHGLSVTASGIYSYAEGYYAIAYGTGSHSEGRYNIAGATYTTYSLSGYDGSQGTVWVDGSNVTASFISGSTVLESSTRGTLSVIGSNYVTAENRTYVSASSLSFPTLADVPILVVPSMPITSSVLNFAHAEGFACQASGENSHAEGLFNIAAGLGSHAEGYRTFIAVYGQYSHAEGGLTIVAGPYSHTEGYSTTVTDSSYAGHAEGERTLVTSRGAHAEGNYTTASGFYSHAEGQYTVAAGTGQLVIGKYNVSSSAESAFIIGSGTSASDRRNLVFASGSAVSISGSLTVSSSVRFISLTSSSVALTNVLMVSSSGQLFVTASSAIGGGGTGTGFPFLGKAIITGSLLIWGSGSSYSTNTVQIIGSGSSNPIFSISGSQGDLFSVTDSLSGSLFAVNDSDGISIIEAFSDSTVVMGNYQAPALYTTVGTAINTGTGQVIYQLPTASYWGVFYDYTIKSGSVGRVGNIMAMWSGSSVNFTETSASSFGTTTEFKFGVIVTGSNMALTGSATTNGWLVRTIIRSI